MSFGGVGEMLPTTGLLDSDVRLLTALVETIVRASRERGLLWTAAADIDASITAPGAFHFYLPLHHGRAQRCRSHQWHADLRVCHPERIEERLDVIQHAAACVIDT